MKPLLNSKEMLQPSSNPGRTASTLKPSTVYIASYKPKLHKEIVVFYDFVTKRPWQRAHQGR